MKTPGTFLIQMLLGLLAGSCALAEEDMDANHLLIESQIYAANGHYKTVLTLIADKKMNAKMTTDAAELEKINSDLATLANDKTATEEEIRSLVDRFNGKESSPPAARRPAAEDVWNGMLSAMREGRMSEIENFATRHGLASLKSKAGVEAEAVFRGWGISWAKWPLRWRTTTDDRAIAVMGPEVKGHTLTFVRTPQGWRLDEWTPGE